MITYYVGGDAGRVQGEEMTLYGTRCFTAAQRLRSHLDLSQVEALLDSGAFSDKPGKRLTPQLALERQFAWEDHARRFCNTDDWQAQAFVSYDLLIDETWTGDTRIKKRWSLFEASRAIDATVAAAEYIASKRAELAPRRIVLTAQGVDSQQYLECADAVLKVAHSGDWFGFGGWCIMGRNKSMLPEFERTISAVLPLVQSAGVRHIHIFGVMWRPALGKLLHEADRHGLTVSTDSGKAVRDCQQRDLKKAGARKPYWRDNVNWWKQELASLRTSEFYKPVATVERIRQLELFTA